MSAKHVFEGSNRRTPLMILFFGGQACAKGAEGREIVALLVKRGADVNAQDEKQNTSLMFAADKCDRETLRMLLKAGAKLNAKNWAGLTALTGGHRFGQSRPRGAHRGRRAPGSRDGQVLCRRVQEESQGAGAREEGVRAIAGGREGRPYGRARIRAIGVSRVFLYLRVRSPNPCSSSL